MSRRVGLRTMQSVGGSRVAIPRALSLFLLTEGEGGSTAGESIITGEQGLPFGTVIEKSGLNIAKVFYVQRWFHYATGIGGNGQGRLRITTPTGPLRQGPIYTITAEEVFVTDVIEIPVNEIIDGTYVIGFWLKALAGLVWATQEAGHFVLTTV